MTLFQARRPAQSTLKWSISEVGLTAAVDSVSAQSHRSHTARLWSYLLGSGVSGKLGDLPPATLWLVVLSGLERAHIS